MSSGGGASRVEATELRRRQVLEAALECFHALGYDKTTMAHIRELAGASTGSIYHHFRSKEELFAALYLEGLEDSRAAGLRALRRTSSAEAGIRALVASYLRWVHRHPEMARYLLTMRRAEFMGEAETRLERGNAEFRQAVGAWMERYVRKGELPRESQDLVWALLLGPSEDFARRWLRGKTSTALRRAADQLGAAAWLSLRGLATRERRRAR